jgi:enoyl-CoA hydratase/carnithine racemase
VYGLPVEFGRKAGRMPPVDAIRLWVVRKLQITGDEADKAAWAIARHIGARGTEGAYMVTQAYNRAIGGNEIANIWSYELERFIEELTK